MKKTVLTALVFTLIISTSSVWSQGPDRQGRPDGPDGPMMSCPVMAVSPPSSIMFNEMVKSLKLTTTQKVKVKNIIVSGEKSIRQLRQKASEATKDLRTAVLAPKYDANKVKSLAVSAEKAEAAIVTANINIWTQIRSIVSVDQAKKMQRTLGMPRPDQQGQGKGNGQFRNPPDGEFMPPPGR